ncbi:hypothetical protein GCM10010336_74610 [Streptomyces goshikiensis]|nr:hypothetical protein GCM10010336_74610 [Streptomyces goshikiensis]
MTGSNCVQSLTFPPVIVNASGRPRPSQARWIFVLSPPRDRPSASPVQGPFSGPGGVLVGPHDRRVDTDDRPVDFADRIRVLLDVSQEPVPGSVG